MSEKKRCPLCNQSLYKRNEGLVCKNWKCEMYFKLARGWVYLDRKKEDSKLFFTSKYDFNIENYKNRKKWLEFKSKLLYKKKVCEVCKSDTSLQVHHILPRFSHPELAMDYENLMVLCKSCHKEIHKENKHRYG